MIKKILGYVFLFGFIAIMGFVTVSFFLSSQPLSLSGFTTYVLTGSINVLSRITRSIMGMWQQLSAFIGVISAGIIGTYKFAKSKIDNAQQNARETELQASRQLQSMQDTIEEQDDKIKELEAKATDQAKLDKQLTESKEAYDQLWGQLQSKTTEVNALERVADPKYVKACEDTLKEHNLPLPERQGTIIVRTEVR